ncbi:MAG: hypothetical protein V1778_04115 [bacterium]
MGFERPDAILEKIDREQSSGNELFDQKIINQWESVRPSIDDFSDLYDEQTREADERTLRERKREFHARGRDAMRLEYMMLDGIYSRNWFGPDTEVTPVSEYDDLFNGVDIIVRFNQPDGEPLFLGIDVTTGEQFDEKETRERIQRKVGRIADGLEKGWKTGVKYYAGDSEEPRGKIVMPRVVIGTDSENIERLFQDFVAALGSRAGGEAIDAHPLQFGMMHQIEKQLAVYTERALRAYLHFRTRTITQHPELRGIEPLLHSLNAIPLSQELLSTEWAKLVETLDDLRPVMTEGGDDLGKTVFQHIDAIQELQRIEKEKHPQNVKALGAREGTEDLLENGTKELLLAA